ncbi:PhnD/SsuA/transferrin family substrate-binding protein [Archangium primigenium]|uniref:PhnD/SsuA/transferrin family substrate-binding protein n=1 Tax=[Archangium] primigenium TaxID=2792470 RepID=UPI00195949F6|nr:PhnD/SsuA/transferrin family substrate-binding protein [Archangium primigenium]
MSVPATPIRFVLAPSMGEVKEHVRAELFGRALTQRLGRAVVVEIAPSFEALERELAEERAELVWGTAEQCTAFEPRARAVLRAVRAGRGEYHAALLCRASQPLSLERLQGARAAWVAPRATAGYLLPIRHLSERGVSLAEAFSEERFFGTYRKALLAVLSGEADLTAIYTSHPEESTVRAFLAEHLGADERRLTPFAYTGPTPADGLILTSRLTEDDAAVLVSALTSLTDRTGGLEPLLGLFDSEGFVPSSGRGTRRRRPPPSRQTEYLAVELDAHARCLRVWTPGDEVFGQDLRDAEGRSLEDVLGLEAAGPLVALARAARHGGGSGRVEYRAQVAGRTHWFAAEASVRARGPGAETAPTMLLVRDVTELRAQEEPLYRLASFPLLHPEPMLEVGPDGLLRYANPAAHLAFPDLLSRGARHPLVEAALAWSRQEVPPDGLGVTPGVLHLNQRSWELTVFPLLDPEGLRVFAKDITARKRMEAKLKADRLGALGSLAAAVGHEMGNPLAYMLANLGFAREELQRVGESLRAQDNPLTRDVAEVVEALVEAADGAGRLKTIVQDLRTLSRAPLEHHQTIDVTPVLEHALGILRGDLRPGVRLERDFREVPAVVGDEARLGQVFVNLLLNASQAMSGGAEHVLRVATYTAPTGEAVVEVQDTGRGMPQEVLARLFEPFCTISPSSKGLGLSVSYAIVTGLGGTLSATSREGQGTTLTVVLPAAPAAAHEARPLGSDAI